jgi:hypothetical protein
LGVNLSIKPFAADIPATRLTSEVFPHLLGDIKTVFMPYLKFASSRLISFSLPMK